MLVTWGQGGIPFAGNVALSQTRLSDDKVLLDWNHKPEFASTFAMRRHNNLVLGDFVPQSPYYESDGSRWYNHHSGASVFIVSDGKDKAMYIPPNLSVGTNIACNGHVIGKSTTIRYSHSPGARCMFKVPAGFGGQSALTLFQCSHTGFRVTLEPRVSWQGGGFVYVCVVLDDDAIWHNFQSPNFELTLNAWHECVVQYDAITGIMSYYLNGNRVHQRLFLSLQTANWVDSRYSNLHFWAPRFGGHSSTIGAATVDEVEYWTGTNYDVNATTIPTYGIHHSMGTVTLLNSTLAGKLTAIDAISIGKITKIEHYNDNWSTIASNSAGLTFPLTGIDMFSSGLFRVTLASTDTGLQRDTPELISFSANLEPVASGRKIIQPYRFGPKIIHIGGII